MEPGDSEPSDGELRRAGMTGRRPSPSALVATILLAIVGLAGCVTPGGPTYAVGGHALAGPTCPAEPASPLPGQCAERPVAGAVIIVNDGTGHEVARATSGSDGSWAVQLPAGTFTIVPQAAVGVMRAAPSQTLTVSATQHPTDLVLEYDTGIR